jgi:uncharacterized CHY-type Zn-finger protein
VRGEGNVKKAENDLNVSFIICGECGHESLILNRENSQYCPVCSYIQQPLIQHDINFSMNINALKNLFIENQTNGGI